MKSRGQRFTKPTARSTPPRISGSYWGSYGRSSWRLPLPSPVNDPPPPPRIRFEPLPDDKVAKLRTLAERGATEGERNAAREALKRVLRKKGGTK